MIKIFNTKTHQIDEFKSIQPEKVTMYVCGQTVYDAPHLGHGMSIVTYDVIRKYLEYAGYEVQFVTNFTDIDDKMIERAKMRSISVAQLAEEMIAEVKKQYVTLGVENMIYLKATDYVKKMIEMIEVMVEKDMAYVASDGLYFDISKDYQYGVLKGQALSELKEGARIGGFCRSP